MIQYIEKNFALIDVFLLQMKVEEALNRTQHIISAIILNVGFLNFNQAISPEDMHYFLESFENCLLLQLYVMKEQFEKQRKQNII